MNQKQLPRTPDQEVIDDLAPPAIWAVTLSEAEPSQLPGGNDSPQSGKTVKPTSASIEAILDSYLAHLGAPDCAFVR